MSEGGEDIPFIESYESLLQSQEDLGDRIKKAQDNFTKSPLERRNQAYCETRLESLEGLWTKFINGHSDILRQIPRKELNKTGYMKNDMFDKTEDIYVNCKCKIKEVLYSLASVSKPNRTDTQSNGNHDHQSNASQVKLPKINIPVFSGKYSEWNTFRDLFCSLIHNNKDLDMVQKLHYLKGYLTGEAEQLLRHIPVTEANYNRCWDLLEQRYNNKKFICNFILKRLFSQKTLMNETPNGLKDLIDTTNDCLAALKNIGVDVGSWDVIVIHILTLKLDSETRRQWEFKVSENNSSDELPTYAQFKEFLTQRYRAMECLPLDNRVKSQKPSQPSNQHAAPIRSFHAVNTKCAFCSEEHKIGYCKKFIKESVDARRKFVLSNNICFCCLGSNHSAKFCHQRNVRCRTCNGKHHTLLHPKGNSGRITGETSGANSNNGNSEETTSAQQDEEQVVSCVSTEKVFNKVLLATALVNAKTTNGENFVIRALIDQGSQSSFVTESTVQALGLKKTPVNRKISGVGGDNGLVSKSMVNLVITSRINPQVAIDVQAFVLKSITSLIPSSKIRSIEWEELAKLVLADPDYHTPRRIDVLLGAEVYSQVIQKGLKKEPQGLLIAQSTSLGWILSGTVQQSGQTSNVVQALHCQVEENDQLKRFWEIEADAQLPREKSLSDEDRYCEDYFAKTTQRDEDGRYIVHLPFNNEKPEVKNSLKIAERRFYALEKRLNNDPNLKKSYANVINEYLQLDHMEMVPKNEVQNPTAVYLPHHAVIREDKDTTKVRAVFDASCKGDNKRSLNDNLFVGPTLQPELRHTIMRWRASPICLTADIVKMYRQVKVANEDADYQRILWRDENSSKLDHYRMLRVTFGVASAPYLAVKCLQQVAKDEGSKYPLAANRVMDSFYMDDLLTGCQTREEGIQLYQEMNELLGKAGFVLQKWTSSDEILVQEMKEIEMNNEKEGNKNGSGEKDAAKDGLKIKVDEIIKIVGLTWNRSDDSFRYTVDVPTLKESKITKRQIISDISRFYDPLGWAGPSIIIPKIIIQKLWLAGIGWDEEVPKVILDEWLAYRKELKILENISVPRWIGQKVDDKVVELHGFSDASKVAYAAVVYMRVIGSDGNVKVTLVSSKTKVAPVKQVSIPRLELCGAVLLTKLMMEIAAVMKIDKALLHAWTDSTVVLAWLNSHPNRWKVFVANRVSEILSNLDSHSWSHVSSKQNPADSASRGLRPSELVNEKMWFQGPEFLHEQEIDYKKPKDLVTNLEETKSFHTNSETSLWERFSSLTRMTRVTAYTRRFIQNCKGEGKSEGFLTTKELREASAIIVKQCQKDNFGEEMAILKRKGNLSKSSRLKSLNPYLDEAGVLRVGGRLTHSQLDEDRKHPILLPKSSHLTKLVVEDAHKQTLHGGPQLMLCHIQSKYFILGARQLVKSCFRRCVTCVKNKGVTHSQLMGELPSARVTPMRPFKNSGVDYAGPIQIRTAKGRGHKSQKGYICLFVCMSTRAIHLEAVTDLTSEGFIQAFRRFVARRGCCSDMWSDNATNFVGAASELKKLFITEKGSMLDEVAESLATNGCNWHFIPSRSPNFGGLWEAGVKSVKHHLKRIIGQSTLTFEEMSTVLTQVEACLNSRPLSAFPGNDNDDVSVLTPGHFLVGEALVSPPERNYESANVSSLRRWQYTQRMLQDFWRRWSHEYLSKFYHRYRWSSSQGPQLKIGDVVIVKEDGLPACRWLYGRVIDVHPGLDNIVRVVSLKIKNGILKRPVTKLCRLPLAE